LSQNSEGRWLYLRLLQFKVLTALNETSAVLEVKIRTSNCIIAEKVTKKKQPCVMPHQIESMCLNLVADTNHMSSSSNISRHFPSNVPVELIN